MMSGVVEIALAIQEEEASWKFTKMCDAWFAVRDPLVRIDAVPSRTAKIEMFFLDTDEVKARDDFKNRVAIACAQAVLLIIGAEPKRKGPCHEAETMSPSPEQRRNDGMD